MRITNPLKYFAYIALVNSVQQMFAEKNYTLCSFPLEIDGVLDDQASYYLTDYDSIY